MSVAENKAVARKAIEEVWHKGNLAAIDDFYGKSLVFHGAPSTGATVHGPEGYRQIVSTYRTAFPDGRFTFDDEIGEGDLLAVHWTYRATHTGVLSGIAPTGRKIVNPGVSILRFAGGKIVEERAIWDERHVYKSLGAEPPA
jgi:predicted ester cyclase